MKKFQLYIHNKSSGPYKVPFKRSASHDEKAKIDGVVKVGKKAIIPSSISHLVDMEQVKRAADNSIIKYRVKEIKAGGK